MNVYQVNVEPKGLAGAGIGHMGSGRVIHIVTDSLQEAMSIARGKITDKEEVQGVWETAKDVVVDYSHVTGQNC